jgi:hypothetical protein
VESGSAAGGGGTNAEACAPAAVSMLSPDLKALIHVLADVLIREAERERSEEVSQPARANRGRLGVEGMSKGGFDDADDITPRSSGKRT